MPHNPLFDPGGRDRPFLIREKPEPVGDPLANRDRFIQLLRDRITSRHQNIVIIDAADTGEGKSTLGIQLARGVYPDWSISDTAYSSADAVALYRQYSAEFTRAFGAGDPLPQKAMLWDEGVLGLLSQGGRRNEELERTVQMLSIIRVVGVSVFLCIPRIRMLDSFVREGLAEYWLMVTERGKARAHRHFLGAMYRRPDRLPYDELESFNPIGFDNLDGLTMSPEELAARPDDAALFRAYEHRKLRAIEEFLEDSPSESKKKVATCPRCGLTSTKFNIETHRCKGAPKAAAGAAQPPSP